MVHLIDKAAVVAEIERRKHKLLDNIMFERDKEWVVRTAHQLNRIILFLDTLEVKVVDLDFQRFAKEMDTVFALPSSETKNTEEEPLNWEYAIAKHFFELGMRVNNLITAADRGVAEEIIINLKRVENDYRLNLTKEIEWVRNQVKKENSYGTIY